jgi:gamma-glutamyltranspeptidase/glutathione hydrolase
MTQKATCLTLILLFSLPYSAYSATSQPVYGNSGMVVSASRLASQIGIDILEKDGNAFDAAAAVGFALAVTYPQAGNLGGGGFMVAVKENGESLTLDFREKAPLGASKDMYLDAQDEIIPGLSLRSPLASGVPGSVDGFLKMWKDQGSGNISRKELISPAIRLANNGFSVSYRMAGSLNRGKASFKKDPGAEKIFVRENETPWRPGDQLIQKDLAHTLKRISRSGRRDFYDGTTAGLLVKQHQATGGLITHQDLLEYDSIYRTPIFGSYKQYDIVSMGPPSSGGVLLVQMLNMLELSNSATPRWNSVESVHLTTEVQRRAYADRAQYLGDADFYDVPIGFLTSKTYAQERRKTISADKATLSSKVLAGQMDLGESEETTHYSVTDQWGNAVSVTITLNGIYGSGIVIEGAGFLMNNEMDDFSSKPGTPNLYGLIGSEANAIAPGKRMLSSMTPTIVMKKNKPYLILGSPGGSTIITTVLQNLINVVDHGMNIQEAINAPRHHSQWLPDQITVEPRAISPSTRKKLQGMGHTINERSAIGQANAIMITDLGFFGAADPRSDNAAVGLLNRPE